MSRSGYCDDYDYDNWEMIRWRGAVAQALRGARGRAFLREMIAALDALPEPVLARHSFVAHGTCALGAVAVQRGLDVSDLEVIDEDDGSLNTRRVGERFGIASAMAAEIMHINDKYGSTPEARWQIMRAWIVRQLEPKP